MFLTTIVLLTYNISMQLADFESANSRRLVPESLKRLASRLESRFLVVSLGEGRTDTGVRRPSRVAALGQGDALLLTGESLRSADCRQTRH
jgi:hypothetical protein